MASRNAAKAAPKRDQPGADLTKYMDKQLTLSLNKNRKLEGVLRGFDAFMNLVMEDVVEIMPGDQRREVGTVVVRGNAITLLERRS